MLRRAVVAGVAALAALVVTAMAAPGVAAGAAPPAGAFTSIVQDTFQHQLRIRGWAVDPARPTSPVTVYVWVDGRYAGSVRADDPSADVDRAHHLRGNHRFQKLVARTAKTSRVVVKTRGARSTGPLTQLDVGGVHYYYPPAGIRVVDVAKRYVGKARYVEGGASPRGFDCSGYTAYAYAHAHVRTLPHSAEAQRHVRGMRLISARSARPGDLVFYLSGGYAYHVAIYAGHGMQYAAATPRDGIRYQRVWSRAVQYRTLTH